MNQPSQQQPPPPGWYQDPQGPGLRWWDGARWSEHRQPAVALPPPPAPTRAVPVLPQQKWWHIPLLVALGVMSTVGWIMLQLLS